RRHEVADFLRIQFPNRTLPLVTQGDRTVGDSHESFYWVAHSFHQPTDHSVLAAVNDHFTQYVSRCGVDNFKRVDCDDPVFCQFDALSELITNALTRRPFDLYKVSFWHFIARV